MISCTHAPEDDRIYKKEGITLQQHGYDVFHICYGKEGKSYTTADGIHILQLKKVQRTDGKWAALRQSRMPDLLEAAREIRASVYHLHDVELCRLVDRLQKLPHHPKVIYDAHEPYGDNFRDYWRDRSLSRVLLRDLPALVAERRALKKADYLIATESNVAARFRKKNPHTAIVYNYSFFTPEDTSGYDKTIDAVYCGSISVSKGIWLMLEALLACKQQGAEPLFVFVGSFADPQLEREVYAWIARHGLVRNVCFPGQFPIEQLNDYYRRSRIALCLFPRNRTNQRILPIKLFEYMSFGLPVVGSDFGHIGDLIARHQAGLTADPHQPQEVAAAILQLMYGDAYKKYGPSSVSLVKEHFVWENQEEVLQGIYSKLLNRDE